MKLEDLAFIILNINMLDQVTFGDDNDGQIIIYTNLRIADGTTSAAIAELEYIPEEEDEDGAI
jgi:hypothetical protein